MNVKKYLREIVDVLYINIICVEINYSLTFGNIFIYNTM